MNALKAEFSTPSELYLLEAAHLVQPAMSALRRTLLAKRAEVKVAAVAPVGRTASAEDPTQVGQKSRAGRGGNRVYAACG
jgi:hypothetical protein